MEILHPEVYEFHNAEIARLKQEGLLMSPGEIMPSDMNEFPSLVGVEAVESGSTNPADTSHFLFSGTLDQVFADVVDLMAARITLDNRMKGFYPDGTEKDDKLRLELYPEFCGRNVGEAIALAHSELSEGLEAIRKSDSIVEPRDDKLPEESALACELADNIIRSLDMSGTVSLRPGRTMVRKLAYNRQRPYKHGKIM